MNISEIIIEGWEKHPEGRKLELKAYDSMTIKPGSIINNQILKKDLNSIYASGWFSGVKIKSEDTPLGVRLIVSVVPNPILKKVKLNPINTIIPKKYVDEMVRVSDAEICAGMVMLQEASEGWSVLFPSVLF